MLYTVIVDGVPRKLRQPMNLSIEERPFLVNKTSAEQSKGSPLEQLFSSRRLFIATHSDFDFAGYSAGTIADAVRAFGEELVAKLSRERVEGLVW